MKLGRAEIIAVIITVIFIIAVAIVSLREHDTGADVSVTTQREAVVEASPSQATEAASSEKAPQTSVNINTASASELCTLPGIGEALSERIIAYREEHGFFAETDDIMNVSGIGAKTYDAFKSYITV